jgi:hemolysin D
VAIAQGKIQPSGRVKTVQPVEGGKITRIHAINGQKVAEGDILIALQDNEAQADVDTVAAQLIHGRAEALRRNAVVASATNPEAPPKILWPDMTPPSVRAREEAVLMTDLGSLSAQLASIDAQRAQKIAERNRLRETITAQESLVTILGDRVDMRQALQQTAAGTKASLIDAMETQAYQKTFLATERGQLIEAERGIEALSAERKRTLHAFIAENSSKGSDAQKLADEAEPRLAKSKIRVANLLIRSPVAGTVQASSVINIGQVLNAGQEVMRIVPDEAVLEVETYLPNKDIGFVHEGQIASVKVEAFPFTRYGTIEATVTRVASDAIALPEAMAAEGNTQPQPQDSKGAAGAQRVQNLYFPVTLKLSQTSILTDGKPVPLAPGMAITAEIKTGKRRLLDYLLSPLKEVGSTALTER